jgi:hypothetical protein
VNLLTTLVTIFFSGLGAGSDREDVVVVTVIQLFLDSFTGVALKVYLPSTPYEIKVALVALIIAVVDWGAGFWIGRRWFKL